MNRDKILTNADRLMDYEGYNTAYLYKYIDASLEAKENLRKILSQHPNWDEENGWIHFSYDTERRIDMNILDKFYRWFDRNLTKINPNITPDERINLVTLVCLVTRQNNFGQYPPETPERKEGQTIEEYTNSLGRDVLTVANKLLKAKNKGHVTKETRVSKILMKIAKAYDLTGYVDIQNTNYMDQSGNWHHNEKDFGWNYQFSQFADAINPLKVKRHTLISINPIDFLTMSWGDNWESCHDTRNSEDPGCYSAGTMSYGMDNVSMIFYYIDQKYADDSNFFELPKQKRAVFCWGEGKLLQSRVYPDGRDGGDFGLAEETRSIVQKVIADCLDIPNLWDLVKGTEHIKTYAVSEGYQYRDYTYYDDCTTSYPKAYGEHNKNKLRIGKYGYCPSCGRQHDQEKSILCSCCTAEYEYWCERCDSGIYYDDENMIRTADGSIYCCSECAQRDGYMYCEYDEDWYQEDDCYYDDYLNQTFHDFGETVFAKDGKIFMDASNAEYAGYVYCQDDDEWRVQTECVQDAWTENWYYDTSDLYIIEGNYFTRESAIEAGYEQDENGEWKEVAA